MRKADAVLLANVKERNIPLAVETPVSLRKYLLDPLYDLKGGRGELDSQSLPPFRPDQTPSDWHN